MQIACRCIPGVELQVWAHARASVDRHNTAPSQSSPPAAQVLEKLDEEGVSRVACLLKGLPYSSVFVVGQAGSFVVKEFGAVDTVVKAGGAARVELGGGGEVGEGEGA